MKERIAEYYDRLDVWFRQHIQAAGNILKLGAVVLACGLLAVWIQRCIVPAPYVPPAPITQAAPITHIPTRTVTPTWTITASRTATARPQTATHTFTATVTERAATSTATYTPSSTPSATRIPAGRDTLPKTGLSAQEISELTPTITATVEPTPTPLTLPDGCKFHSLLLESDKDYTELTFRCPNGEKTAEPVGG
jgi:hypothetical protein